jgi:SAM-dependent methyltransferase
MLKKQKISCLVRNIGLIKVADKIRFYLLFIKTYKFRKKFFSENKDITLPPPYYIYETFGLNYSEFYLKSIGTSEWIVSCLSKFKELKNVKILDWGCGPGRIIIHISKIVSRSCELYGTDYNEKYISWCRKNIPNIEFKVNDLKPPLNFEDEYFDIVYGISILTHLSEDLHMKWFKELSRVTKPGGIILLTLSGSSFKTMMTDKEKETFDNGKLVVRSNTKEGHRTYTTFQPEQFVRELIGTNLLLEHTEGAIKNGKPQQDVWIIKKV